MKTLHLTIDTDEYFTLCSALRTEIQFEWKLRAMRGSRARLRRAVALYRQILTRLDEARTLSRAA